jgi:hypothetical protein
MSFEEPTEVAGMLLFDELLELATPASALVETTADTPDDAEYDAAEVTDTEGDDLDDDDADYDDVMCDVCSTAVPHSDRVFVCTELSCDFAACQRCQKSSRLAQTHAHALKETFNFTFAYRVFDDADDPRGCRRVADTHGALTLLLLSTEPTELNLITRVHIVTSDTVINAADPRPLRIVAAYHAKVGAIEWHVELSDEQLARLVELLRRYHPIVEVS